MESNETSSIRYTSSLLGNIKSHLASLQGYDVMALELIQNADDAKATSIRFDIRDDALYVYNDCDFSYCGDLRKDTCQWLEENGYACDFHRIIKVGSGGKATKSENIGRFGIGFVSCYQVTDNPIIESSGLKLTLQPEIERCESESIVSQEGTQFILPWAKDSKSIGRISLMTGPITDELITQLTSDFEQIVKKSLLFLKHLKVASVYRNGELIASCEIDRYSPNSLNLKYSRDNLLESWLLLRGDAKLAAEKLYERFDILQLHDRSTEFTIAIRTSPQSLDEGLLYAFLPTTQGSGLPLHINADFFPKTDRKDVIFEGHQYQQKWNEMLVRSAAECLTKDLPSLLNLLGDIPFWELLKKAYRFASSQIGFPDFYRVYWDSLKDKIPLSQLVRTADMTLERSNFVFIPKTSLSLEQTSLLAKLKIKLVNPSLNDYREILKRLNTKVLDLVIFEQYLSSSIESISFQKEDYENFYKPLWQVIEVLIPNGLVIDSKTKDTLEKIKRIKVYLNHSGDRSMLDVCRTLPQGVLIGDFKLAFPFVQLASNKLNDFPKTKEFESPLVS
ncbi:sacsin N-terminal ATP-binding-like domain-containing protein [Thalassolituus oleivorans]|uniref:sacsin N-terminal ATP-binding-like domain-containing protein n=1 Tax=Thalassolituus oleivorans TaxID=187493 RepID=UPI001CE2C280|nr:hypothetical protein [Thalassolituus oleivorans]MCA6127291.1 hypothetical protein [Thalassolituus oleivorans 4BN06-13]